MQRSAAGLFKHVWPFSRHQALRMKWPKLIFFKWEHNHNRQTLFFEEVDFSGSLNSNIRTKLKSNPQAVNKSRVFKKFVISTWSSKIKQKLNIPDGKPYNQHYIYEKCSWKLDEVVEKASSRNYDYISIPSFFIPCHKSQYKLFLVFAGKGPYLIPRRGTKEVV